MKPKQTGPSKLAPEVKKEVYNFGTYVIKRLKELPKAERERLEQSDAAFAEAVKKWSKEFKKEDTRRGTKHHPNLR